jgi:hypothetical protein
MMTNTIPPEPPKREISNEEKKAEFWYNAFRAIYLVLLFPSFFIPVFYLITDYTVVTYPIFFCLFVIPLSIPISVYFMQKNYDRDEYGKMYLFCWLPVLIFFVSDAILKIMRDLHYG